MLNRDGIQKQTLGMTNQILANVDVQSSVGCVVSSAVGVTVGQRKIAKAGTPIKVNLLNREGEAAVTADATSAMNAVLLHDVDVTSGNANGTALLIGVVNLNRVDDDVATLITAATGNTDATKLIIFIKA